MRARCGRDDTTREGRRPTPAPAACSLRTATGARAEKHDEPRLGDAGHETAEDARTQEVRPQPASTPGLPRIVRAGAGLVAHRLAHRGYGDAFVTSILAPGELPFVARSYMSSALAAGWMKLPGTVARVRSEKS